MKPALDLAKIKQSANKLSVVSEKQANMFLRNLSDVLLLRQKEISAANKKDITKAKINGLSSAFIDRLVLDEEGIKNLILKLKDIERLQSSVGDIIEEKIVENKLLLRKVRASLGVILVIYEARPEVTIDVAALCIKSGNAAILKGGSEALETNKILYSCIKAGLEKSGLNKESLNFISSEDRKITSWLLTQHDYIDLVIARGGYGLVKTILKQSTIPVMAHAAGGARIYVDKTADLSIAEKIIINAKTSKPAACNSLDTVVVHQEIAAEFKSKITSVLKATGVKIIENEWDTELLGLRMSIKVVRNVEEAVDFINRHGRKHSEGIVAADKKIIHYFTKSVDTAALFINCSTRLHDGYVFGLGSEMGISTGKLHARGPVGLKELTTYKWEVYGNGQTRE
mgnify:CR=1 FL=1